MVPCIALVGSLLWFVMSAAFYLHGRPVVWAVTYGLLAAWATVGLMVLLAAVCMGLIWLYDASVGQALNAVRRSR